MNTGAPKEEDTSLRLHSKRAEASRHGDFTQPIEERFADEARFFKTWFENPMRTGAVSPSGRFLSRMMARYVDPDTKGAIIELGPGTGPVTQALLQRGVAPERLTLVEFDPAFCRLLRRRFPRCAVVQGDAYDLRGSLDGALHGPAAAFVSSLPLLTRPEAQRVALIEQAFDMMAPDGCFVQFTYGMVSPIARRSKEAGAFDFAAEASPAVWLNLPPARVWIYRRAKATAPERKPKQDALIIKLKQRTDRVCDEFKEKREKVESEIKARTARARLEFAVTTRKVRNDPALRPAMNLLRKMGEGRKPPR